MTDWARFNADLADNNFEPDRLVWLACDFLLADVDTPALRELAGESPTTVDSGHAYALARQMLVELGVEPMPPDQAHWFLGRETARRILAGAPRPEWNKAAWRINTSFSDDEVYWASGQYDTNPEPYLGYVRDYLRRADEQLGAS